MSSPRPARSKKKNKAKHTHTQGKQDIPRPLLTLLAVETLHILLGLGAPTRSLKSFFYSSFHLLLLLSVQTAGNARPNIVLVTQALTKTGGWLPFSFFFRLRSQRRRCVTVAVVVAAAVGGYR